MDGVFAPAGAGIGVFDQGAAAIAARGKAALHTLDNGNVFLEDVVEQVVEFFEIGTLAPAGRIDDAGLARAAGRKGFVDGGDKGVGTESTGPEDVRPLPPGRQALDIPMADSGIVEARLSDSDLD